MNGPGLPDIVFRALLAVLDELAAKWLAEHGDEDAESWDPHLRPQVITLLRPVELLHRTAETS
jgi:hypothetical protein